jgi:hypothetical protein
MNSLSKFICFCTLIKVPLLHRNDDYLEIKMSIWTDLNVNLDSHVQLESPRKMADYQDL